MGVDCAPLFGQIVLLNNDFIASLKCTETKTELVLFKLKEDSMQIEKRFVLISAGVPLLTWKKTLINNGIMMRISKFMPNL